MPFPYALTQINAFLTLLAYGEVKVIPAIPLTNLYVSLLNYRCDRQIIRVPRPPIR